MNRCVNEWLRAFVHFTMCGAAEETAKWRSITIAAYVLCIGMGAYILTHEEHGQIERTVCNFWRMWRTPTPDFLTWRLHLEQRGIIYGAWVSMSPRAPRMSPSFVESLTIPLNIVVEIVQRVASYYTSQFDYGCILIF